MYFKDPGRVHQTKQGYRYGVSVESGQQTTSVGKAEEAVSTFPKRVMRE